MREKHPGAEGFMFVVGKSLSKPLLSPAQQLNPLTLEGALLPGGKQTNKQTFLSIPCSCLCCVIQF